MSKLRQPWLLTALVLICLLSLLSSAASITAYAFQGRTPPRTLVAGSPIGNLEQAEALNVIKQKQHELSQTVLDLSLDGTTVSVSLNDLGISINSPDQNKLLGSASPWDWTSPQYWNDFFTQKAIDLSYTIDEEAARKKIDEAFNISVGAEDAKLEAHNGSLQIIPAKSGKRIALDRLIAGLESLTRTGSVDGIALAAEEIGPIISDQAAAQTKAEIEESLRPIHLQGEERSFAIPVADQYLLLAYEAINGRLIWKVDDAKLQAYLNGRIASRLNTKMVQRTIQSDTGQVVQEGKDGKSVELSRLTELVKSSITSRTETESSPLAIPIVTKEFTEKVVHPEYVAGLFEGRYVDINLSKQKLFIIDGDTLIASHLISSGKAGTPTPTGVFYVKNKIGLAQSRLYPGIWMRKWNALSRNPDGSGYEGYGIHDLPCFDRNCNVIEGASHLGRPVSHGCVRLGPDAANWFFDHIPVGTPVNIHR